MAETITLTTNGAGHYTGTFSAIHDAAFTDTYTFLPVFDASTVDASVISIGFLPVSDITFTSVTLNGVALTLASGAVDVAYTSSPFPMTGPLTLVVSGLSGQTASYAGTMNMQPVPEADTYAMVLAGLGLVGWLARRRITGAALPMANAEFA